MKLFGFDIYTSSKKELIESILNSKSKMHIISGNAEVLKYPLKDNAIMDKFLDNKNLIIPDGISVSIPLSKKYKIPVDRITGIDLMESLLEVYEKENKSIFLLGAKQETLDKLLKYINFKYPKLNIAGSHNGYIDTNNCEGLIETLKKSQAHTLFVAMGTPLQENFIFNNIEELPFTVYMGVGGSFDVLSGNIKRAPKWMQKIGLEWLYRLIKDPSKITRLFNNIFFTIKALLHK